MHTYTYTCVSFKFLRCPLVVFSATRFLRNSSGETPADGRFPPLKCCWGGGGRVMQFPGHVWWWPASAFLQRERASPFVFTSCSRNKSIYLELALTIPLFGRFFFYLRPFVLLWVECPNRNCFVLTRVKVVRSIFFFWKKCFGYFSPQCKYVFFFKSVSFFKVFIFKFYWKVDTLTPPPALFNNIGLSFFKYI